MTEREQILQWLLRAFNWKYNALAAYAVEAQPYVAPGREAVLEELKKIAREEADAVDPIAQAIEQMDGIPQVAPYAPAVSELNYLAVDYLANLVAEDLEHQREAYSKACHACNGTPDAKQLFESLAQSAQAASARIRALEPDARNRTES